MLPDFEFNAKTVPGEQVIMSHNLGGQRKKAIYRPRGLLHLAVKS